MAFVDVPFPNENFEAVSGLEDWGKVVSKDG